MLNNRLTIYERPIKGGKFEYTPAMNQQSIFSHFTNGSIRIRCNRLQELMEVASFHDTKLEIITPSDVREAKPPTQ